MIQLVLLDKISPMEHNLYEENGHLFLLTVYGKSAQDDLNTNQKKRIAALAKILKAECRERKSHA